MSAALSLSLADTEPTPAPLKCRCGPVTPAIFASWPPGKRWRLSDDEPWMLMKTCPICRCSLSVEVA